MKQKLHSNKRGTYHLNKMDSSDDFQSIAMNPQAHRRLYFITSSQANRILYPTTESFGLDTTVKRINNFSIYNYNKTFIFLLFSRKGQTL